MLRSRDAAVRSRLTFVVDAVISVVSSSSAVVVRPDVVLIGCNPDESKVEGVRVLDLELDPENETVG